MRIKNQHNYNSKMIESNSDLLCQYGCGQKAKFILKNGKYCCSECFNKCPQIRQKNSKSIKKCHEQGKILTRSTISKLKQNIPWNKGKILKPKTYHPGKCEVCGKDHDGTYGSGRFCSQSCANKIGINIRKNKHKSDTISKILYDKNPKLCKICGNPIDYHHRFSRLTCSDACNKILCKISANSENTKNKIKQSYIEHGTKPGGYRKGSGKGKHGWYKGFWCDSSWELAFTIYNIDHNIKFQRYKGYFEYEYKGEKYKYYPDYIMSDGSLVEIKGRHDVEQWKIKLECIPSTIVLRVITWKEIQVYLKYVKNKYGNDFINLYENKNSI